MNLLICFVSNLINVVIDYDDGGARARWSKCAGYTKECYSLCVSLHKDSPPWKTSQVPPGKNFISIDGRTDFFDFVIINVLGTTPRCSRRAA